MIQGMLRVKLTATRSVKMAVAVRAGRRRQAEMVMKMIAAIQAGERRCRNSSLKDGGFASVSWMAAKMSANQANEKGSSERRVVPRARMNAPSIEGTTAIASRPARNARALVASAEISCQTFL